MQDDDLGKMKMSCGEIHKHLGVNFNFEEKGKLKINVNNCVNSVVEDFGKHFEENEKNAMLATQHLFEVRDATKIHKNMPTKIHFL